METNTPHKKNMIPKQKLHQFNSQKKKDKDRNYCMFKSQNTSNTLNSI